jgi:hypothetical protein
MDATMNTLGNYRPPRITRAIGVVVLLAASIFVVACATTPPPTEQMALAGAAVSRATNAGGGEVAPAEMQSARQKLENARLAMAAADNDKALLLAQEAQVDAQLAEVKARSSTARKAAEELQEGVRVLREEIYRKNK